MLKSKARIFVLFILILWLNLGPQRILMMASVYPKHTKSFLAVSVNRLSFALSRLMCNIYLGCHDNGYVNSLRSQITAGFKQKLILLRSYSDMAAGIADLDLPVLTIPELFSTKKLVVTSPTSSATNIVNDPPGLTRTSPRVPPASPLVHASMPLITSELGRDPSALAKLEVVAEALPGRRPSITTSYSSIVQCGQRRLPTPELDYNGSTTSDDEASDLYTTPVPTRSKPINPRIVSDSSRCNLART